MVFEPQPTDHAMWTPSPLGEMDPRLLAEGEVHLHLLPLAQPASVVDNLASVLTSDEHERAQRFHFDRDRRRFIVSRGLLRRLLARYADMRAEAIRFAYGPFDKPYLAAGAGEPKLEFSLSHSDDWALAGLVRGRGIGVDLEAIRLIDDYLSLAKTNFAPAETTAILDLADGQQIEGFFACWTRKEAYAKALGLGLSLDLASFVVSVKPIAGAEAIPAREGAAAHRVWGTRPLPGFWAAMALETPPTPMEPIKIRLATHSVLAT